MSDEAKTCGECKHCHRADIDSTVGACEPPRPPWLLGRAMMVYVDSKAAEVCECFERKDAK